MTESTKEQRAKAAETFAKYHDERARYGGASWEFHARAATFLRDQAQALAECDARIGELERHYDAAGPEHNLLALLDSYLDRAQLAENGLANARDEIAATRLGLAQTPPPGTVAVELGDSTTIRELSALSYLDDEGEVCRPLTPVRFQGLDLDTEYSVTLLLKPGGG